MGRGAQQPPVCLVPGDLVINVPISVFGPPGAPLAPPGTEIEWIRAYHDKNNLKGVDVGLIISAGLGAQSNDDPKVNLGRNVLGVLWVRQ